MPVAGKQEGGVALVVGATGVVGWTMLKRLAANPRWKTIGLARRLPAEVPGDRFVSLDLLDRAAVLARADMLAKVTHVFVATRLPGADAAAEERANLTALSNLMDALDPAALGLRHVCLVHGTKWYGSHLGPYKTPAKEGDPRHMPPNFYHAQHDFIAERQRGRPWTWSTLRPHTVWGYSRGTGNSLVTAVGVYAAISRELGLPLRFPGPLPTYRKISQGVTAELLSEAMEWVATSPDCANDSFNITNGDYFRWEHLWPAIAARFDLAVGPVQTIVLANLMADKAPVWDRIVRKHRLQPSAMSDLVNWSYLDGLLAATWDDLSSTLKARRYGFHAMADSEEAFLTILAQLRQDRVLP